MAPFDARILQAQILGAAVNAITSALLNFEGSIGDFPRRAELLAIDNDEFYPLPLYLELVEFLEARLTPYAFAKLGESVAARVMQESFNRRTIRTVAEALDAVQKSHEVFCRPVIGSFEVTSSSKGVVHLRYDAPYNCVLQEGLFARVALAFGGSQPTVSQTKCRRHGAAHCEYEIRFNE